jgi:hypothetical protein
MPKAVNPPSPVCQIITSAFKFKANLLTRDTSKGGLDATWQHAAAVIMSARLGARK